MKNKFKIIILTSVLLIFIGCKPEGNITQESFLFNTRIKITVHNKNNKKEEEIKKIIKKAFLKIKEIESNYSSYKKGSFVNEINKKAGSFVKVDKTGINLIKEAKDISNITDGKFDITIKPLFDLWGFGNKSIQEVPKKEEILKKLHHVDYKRIKIKEDKIKIDKDQTVDLSSFLKGYAIYMAGQELKKSGIDDFLISSISSIEVAGKKAENLWRVGIQNPNEPSEILKILEIKDKAIGVSGDYQTYFEVKNKRYHHILDGKTGYPVDKNKMVIVIASNAYIADIYSTALFMLEPEKIIKKVDNVPKMDVMVIDKKNKRYYSKNMEKYITNK
ncbi:MAG: FAD:protein FMN transferase [Fusobacteriota bacterium]